MYSAMIKKTTAAQMSAKYQAASMIYLMVRHPRFSPGKSTCRRFRSSRHPRELEYTLALRSLTFGSPNLYACHLRLKNKFIQFVSMEDATMRLCAGDRDSAWTISAVGGDTARAAVA